MKKIEWDSANSDLKEIEYSIIVRDYEFFNGCGITLLTRNHHYVLNNMRNNRLPYGDYPINTYTPELYDHGTRIGSLSINSPRITGATIIGHGSDVQANSYDSPNS